MKLTVKRWTLHSLSFLILFLGGIGAPIAMAQTSPDSQPDSQTDSQPDSDTYSLSPFDLVESAYRGELEDNGIPGYGTLQAEYDEGITNARDIIRAAVRAGSLPSSALQDDRYLNDVEFQLRETLRSN